MPAPENFPIFPPISPWRPACAAALFALAVAGCTVKEPATEVALELPADWSEASAVPATAGEEIPAAWWRGFGSARLDGLIAEAMRGSSDLRSAVERVRQADIALQLAGASLLPGVTASAGSSASRSEGSGTRKATNLSLNTSYELDLWGRLSSEARGAQALAHASRHDLETVRITLAAAVATTYFQLLSTRERLSIAQKNLATAERMLGIVEARLRLGVATPLEVSQQTTAVLQQRTTLAPLELQIRQTGSALAVLLGRQPVGFDPGTGDTLMRLQPPSIAPGLPSTLLTRRPDLRAAEARLAGADANVAAARAALLPNISLTAGAGVSSGGLVSLADGVSSVSLAASLAQTIFDGGRKRLQVEVTRSQRQVLIETYASAVRSALKEADDALGNASTSQRQERTQGEVVTQAQRTLDLAELRYREGSDTLLTVLDAQRTLFGAQEALAMQRLARLTAAVDLYRALGGGWQGQVLSPEG